MYVRLCAYFAAADKKLQTGFLHGKIPENALRARFVRIDAKRFLQHVLFDSILATAAATAAAAAIAAVVLQQRYGGRVDVVHFGHVAVAQVALLAERGGRGRVVARVLVPAAAQARRTPRRRLGPAALQRLLERHAELPVEVRVDERVQRRVEVAHPEHQHGDPARHPRAAAFQQRAHYVPRQRETPALFIYLFIYY